MQAIKPGTKVRIRSHPQVVGTYEIKGRLGISHWIKVPWAVDSICVQDENLEVVPPKPFTVGDVKNGRLAERLRITGELQEKCSFPISAAMLLDAATELEWWQSLGRSLLVYEPTEETRKAIDERLLK